MSRHRVSCINKRGGHYSPHERISHIGGVNENGTRSKLPEDEAIKAIEDKKYEFFVSVNGRSVNVIVATHNGRKYLKTETAKIFISISLSFLGYTCLVVLSLFGYI